MCVCVLGGMNTGTHYHNTNMEMQEIVLSLHHVVLETECKYLDLVANYSQSHFASRFV